MKKIYMPSDSTLARMESSGINVYKYVLIKMIESIIVDGKNLPNKGMLKGTYKYLLEDPDVVHSICLLYPEEITYSDIAKHDMTLLDKLINKSSDTSVYNLDYLSKFTYSTTHSTIILRNAVETLGKGLQKRPEYRFEYQNNELLDDIFACKLDPSMFYISLETARYLTAIEPAYAFLLKGIKLDGFNNELNEEAISHLLFDGLIGYAERYDIDFPNRNGNINLSHPTTKRLIKAIRRNPNNLY